MSEMIRHCPDCGGERPFEQYHAGPRGCPDSPDAYCHEWSCTACGTGLLIGFIPFMYEPAGTTDPHVRVA
jgi:hypothetical protein